jgi:hypothetical protein
MSQLFAYREFSTYLLGLVYDLWPKENAPLSDWVHYIEACMGLIIVSSIYRRLTLRNKALLTAYAQKMDTHLRTRFEHRGPNYIAELKKLIEPILTKKDKDNDGSEGILFSVAFVGALLCLLLLYIEATHPTAQVSPLFQVVMSFILFIPIPFAFFFVAVFQMHTRARVFLVLRTAYQDDFRKRLGASVAVARQLYQLLSNEALLQVSDALTVLETAATAFATWCRQRAASTRSRAARFINKKAKDDKLPKDGA